MTRNISRCFSFFLSLVLLIGLMLLAPYTFAAQTNQLSGTLDYSAVSTGVLCEEPAGLQMLNTDTVKSCTTHTCTGSSAESPAATDWNGAEVVFVGDSITYGSGTNKTYHAFIGDMGVFGSVQAMGIGGSCISAQSDYGYGTSLIYYTPR